MLRTFLQLQWGVRVLQWPKKFWGFPVGSRLNKAKSRLPTYSSKEKQRERLVDIIYYGSICSPTIDGLFSSFMERLCRTDHNNERTHMKLTILGTKTIDLKLGLHSGQSQTRIQSHDQTPGVHQGLKSRLRSCAASPQKVGLQQVFAWTSF